MICDACQEDHGEFFHRCRADENSCIDGKDCPDYIERCECWCMKWVNENNYEAVTKES